MEEATGRVTAGLRQAMRAEVEGHSFYLMAARVTTDDKGRAVFEQLAAEELAHLEFLKRQHRSIVETGKADPAVSLAERSQLVGPSPIFSAAIRGRLAEAHFEMTALSVGIQLELSAETFYRKCGEDASDPTIRAFMKDLAEWEAGHYRALLAQQTTLKEDYWSSSGFSPF